MALLLHILAHPNPETSQTVQIAEALLSAYREAHPEDTVQVFDLYRVGIPHLSSAHLSAIAKQGQVEVMSEDEQRAWDDLMSCVRQFAAADRFLVTAPMWNFGVPSILKAYIDHIVLAGYTFRYTGPGAAVGMMTGKRMAIVSTHGGIYSQPPMSNYEQCVSFLRDIFGFLGIDIVGEAVAEGLALVGPRDQEIILQAAMRKAEEIARVL